MDRLKPEKIRDYRITGRIVESTKNELKFVISGGNKEIKGDIKQRVQKIASTRYNSYNKPYFDNLPIHLFYLTRESLKGEYKDPEMNLPYEILDGGWKLVYRQSIKEKKEDIYNRLEKAAIDEGLRD